MASISEIRKQLDEVKASIRAFTDGIHDVVQSIYSKVEMIESTDLSVEKSTTETNLTVDNGNTTTPLRGYATSVSTPAYGFTQAINPRRLTSTGGINDSLHSTLAGNTPAAPTSSVNNDNDGTQLLPVPPLPPTLPPTLSLPPLPSASQLPMGANNIASIETVIRRYGKDLISNINVLWYYSNLQTDQTRSLTVTPTESLLLGKLDALKPYRIGKLDILHVATRIVKIIDLLSQTRAIDSVPTVGFVEPGIRSIVISKFLAINALPPLAERMVLLQFENATDLVLSQPHEYGLGALIAGVIKCLSGMRNNSVFVDVLRKLTMFVPSVHEGKMYSIDLAHQALQAYHKLFTTIVEMSRMLYPSAVDNYPRLHLVSIYLDGLKSKGISSNPFSKVVESLGTAEYSTFPQVYSVLLDMFTSTASMELVGTPKTYLTWGGSSQRRMHARTDYIKSQPTLHAMVTSSGYNTHYDAYEVPDFEIDEYLYSMNNNQDYADEEVSSVTDDPVEAPSAATSDGYLRSKFMENEEMEQLYALSAMDAPCWVHFGHTLFQDPKPCSRRECKHSHNHEDPVLADLYRNRQRDTHLKMMRSSRGNKGRSSTSGPPASTKPHHHHARGK